MEFLSEYGLFLAKTITFLIAVAILIGLVASATGKGKKPSRGQLEVNHLNESLLELGDQLRSVVLPADEIKTLRKQRKQDEKSRSKNKSKSKKEPDQNAVEKRSVYVLDFKGDMRASAVSSLREEITAVLALAKPSDEIVVKLESAGGMVHAYGLASSQLDRIKKHGVPLTVCVDKVAASGGYMMACVADKLVAAPFSIIGSIGVVAQLPNFHRLLKKHDIDYEMFTAGEYKRTLTVFGENTDKGREKFVEELEETHDLFKGFVQSHRPSLDINKIATGEIWLGEKALGLGMVDELATSDEYLVNAASQAEVYEVHYVARKSIQEKMGLAAENSIDGLATRAIDRIKESEILR
ncbi:MAG: protease SohB [bacterium]